jgi:hypothetical protein
MAFYGKLTCHPSATVVQGRQGVLVEELRTCKKAESITIIGIMLSFLYIGRLEHSFQSNI